ncbi:uncharacterized protein KGF55_001400 [Candida pseudojiufengensis]|uniref:uncharacterized protein n=1 Tax=Candida pseudojiufengensis TaxID=497109 RepID=UPI0022251E0A|nr:uncharacterized protein KGF55_001400 [Candida pseudojiufengensis]KAI5965180.1 hypothetical protein KGF55_001400 [Candida pseudojiufengensis]
MSFIPSNYADVEYTNLKQALLLHIIRIENISQSKSHQIDEWQEISDPNNVSVDRLNKSNRIVREINMEDDTNQQQLNSTLATEPRSKDSSIYKLLLRDKFNNFIYAYELEPLRFLRNENMNTPIPIKLGGRILIKPGTIISRGVLMLDHKNCEYKGLHQNDQELINNLNENIGVREIDILSNEIAS